MLKQSVWILLGIGLLMLLSGCGVNSPAAVTAEPKPTAEAAASAPEPKETPVSSEEEKMETLQLLIDESPVTVDWEENESVQALRELCRKEPLTIRLSMYGGFEQVGPIGTSLPRSDVQTTTESGDVVLYAGNQIVVFYGSNSWAYTRLGHISDPGAKELATRLGVGDVTISLRLEAQE